MLGLFRVTLEQIPKAPITHTPYTHVELWAESEVEARQSVLWLFRGYLITTIKLLKQEH